MIHGPTKLNQVFETSVWLDRAIIGLTAAILHLSLLRSGIIYFHSDYAPTVIVSEQFLKGNWNAFTFQMDYGGLLFTPFHSLWVLLLEKLGVGYLDRHLSFTFGVLPALFSMAVHFAASQFSSRKGAFFSAFLAAVGLRYFDTQLPNEVYLSYLILGAVLFGLRGPVTQSWSELSTARRFGIGFAAGASLYASRISMIFLIPALIPFSLLFNYGISLARPRDQIDRVLLFSASLLLALFFYLEIFGPEMGTFHGKMLKLHAQPNLKYAVLLILPIAVRRMEWKSISAQVKTLLPFILGGILGFLPEIVHIFQVGHFSQTKNSTYSFQDSMHILGFLPLKLREIFSASDSLFRVFSCLIWIGGTCGLIWNDLRNRSVSAISFCFLLGILANIRVFNFYDFAPTRYFLPLLIPIYLGLGLFFDRLELNKWRSGLSQANFPLIAFLMVSAVHAGAQVSSRIKFNHDSHWEEYIEAIGSVISTFRAQSVKLVLTNNYWNSNSYTLLSRENPVFLPEDLPRPLLHPKGLDLLQTESRVGIYLNPPVHLGSKLSSGAEIRETYAGKTWALKPLQSLRSSRSLQDNELLIGTQIRSK